MEPLQKNRKPKQNHAACPVERLPELIAEIHSYDSMSARACEFSILTATRSQAVRLAQWDEINLEKGTWIIPIEHDKVKAQNRDRTIFLSSQALDLLRTLCLPQQPWQSLLRCSSDYVPSGSSRKEVCTGRNRLD